MMIGVLSGTYSSIFIASPVLTAWKSREHGYRQREARIVESMGYLPAYPEDNVVAKLGDDGGGGDAIESGTPAPIGAGAVASEPLMIEDAGAGKALHVPDAEAPAPSRADVELPEESATPEPGPPAPEPSEASAESDRERAKRDHQRQQQKKRRQQRKRRKHGRHR